MPISRAFPACSSDLIPFLPSKHKPCKRHLSLLSHSVEQRDGIVWSITMGYRRYNSCTSDIKLSSLFFTHWIRCFLMLDGLTEHDIEAWRLMNSAMLHTAPPQRCTIGTSHRQLGETEKHCQVCDLLLSCPYFLVEFLIRFLWGREPTMKHIQTKNSNQVKLSVCLQARSWVQQS